MNGAKGRSALVTVWMVGIAAVGLVSMFDSGLGSWGAGPSDRGATALRVGAWPKSAPAMSSSGSTEGTRSTRTPIRVAIKRRRLDPRCPGTVRVPIPVLMACRSNE